jgi:pantothenate kinase type III
MPDETPAAMAIAVRKLLDCAVIDGGDTVAVRFIAADGQIVGVLIPRGIFAELQATVPDGSGRER